MGSGNAQGLRREQAEKAVSALLKYIGTQKADSKDLLEDEEYLYLVITTQNYFQTQALHTHSQLLTLFCKNCRTLHSRRLHNHPRIHLLSDCRLSSSLGSFCMGTCETFVLACVLMLLCMTGHFRIQSTTARMLRSVSLSKITKVSQSDLHALSLTQQSPANS